jgi:4-amino-4-deoxy-L-arabinose transferase-like glycosyltransferase
LLVTLFAAVLMLPSVGSKLIVTGDEARFSLLAQDMLARGTWFDGRVREQRYRNKPLLYPAMIKVLSMPGGRVTETTAQLPIALAAVAAVFLTARLGHRLFGPRVGVWSGLALATSYAFFAHSQILLPDMLVVAFGVASLLSFWRAMTEPPGTWALVAFYAFLALGGFAKGPMGLLPLLVVVAWLLTEEGWRGLRRLGSRAGLIAFVVLSLAWLLPFIFAGGKSFAQRVLWTNWLTWYLGIPHPLKVLNLWLEAAKGLMPWTTLFVLPLLLMRREWRNPAYRFAFLAWLVPFIAVSLSSNHRVRYLLPTYPAAALLVAWWVDRHGGERSRAVKIVLALTVVGALAGLAVTAHPWFDAADRASVSGFWWKAGLIAAGTLAMVGFLCWATLRRPVVLVPGVALAMALLLVPGWWIYADSTNRLENYRGLAVLVERHARGGPVSITGGRFFSIDFYLERPLVPVRTTAALDEWLTRPDRPLAVVAGRAWRSLREQIKTPAEVLDTMRVRGHDMVIVRRASP